MAPAAGAKPQILAHGTTAPVGDELVRRTSASGDLVVLWYDGQHVAEAVVLAPGAAASKPARLSRCGDPSPVKVDRTGRAVFVAHRDGDLVAWSTAPLG